MNLSYSRIKKYEVCPRQYKYYYEEGWRTKRKSANFEFGKAIHQALEKVLKWGIDPEEVFLDYWEELEDEKLEYSKRDNWQKLKEKGCELIDKFERGHWERFNQVEEIEARLERQLTKDIKLMGFVDWLGLVRLPSGKEKFVLVDFKTSSQNYSSQRIIFNDQLTCYYALAKEKYPEIERVAYVVFVKKKEPEIQWLTAEVDNQKTKVYLEKIKKYYSDIEEKRFYPVYGAHCNWCDFQPLCLQDQKRVEEELEKRKFK